MGLKRNSCLILSMVLLTCCLLPLDGWSACTLRPSGMVGWWKADGNPNDSGGTNNGTLNGEVGYAAGWVGQSFSFDGSSDLNDYVALPAAASYLLNDSAGTITAWVYPTAIGDNDVVVAFGSGSGGQGVGLGIWGNVYIYHHFGTYDWQTATSVSPDTWTLLTYTWDATTERIYKNGMFSESRPRNFSYVPGNGRIGHGFWGDTANAFPGLIDEVAVFNRTLSDQEITAIFAAGGDGMCSCLPPASGLVSWWRAEGEANDFWDGNHGTLQNGVAFTAGKVGQAFSFDGVDDYVEVGTGANSINRIGGDISIAAWIKTDSVSDDFKFIAATRESSGEEKGWEFLAEKSNLGGQLTFQIDTGPITGYRLGTSNIRDGQWHHVVGIRSGTNLYVYVDGMLENGATQGGVGGMISSTAATFIGKTPSVNDNDNARWEGQIDEVAIFNRALSANEIAAIYAAGSAGICAMRTIYMPLILKN